MFVCVFTPIFCVKGQLGCVLAWLTVDFHFKGGCSGVIILIIGINQQNPLGMVYTCLGEGKLGICSSASQTEFAIWLPSTSINT